MAVSQDEHRLVQVLTACVGPCITACFHCAYVQQRFQHTTCCEPMLCEQGPLACAADLTQGMLYRV